MTADRRAGKAIRLLKWAALGAATCLAGQARASAPPDCAPTSGLTSCRLSSSVPSGVAPPNPGGKEEQWVSVWVDLELPALASVPPENTARRGALHLQIQAQQDAVMAGLRALGAIEQARVKVVRNAIAVRLPRTQMGAAREIPGVRAVRPARSRNTHPLGQME